MENLAKLFNAGNIFILFRNTKTNSLYALKKIFKSVIDEYGM